MCMLCPEIVAYRVDENRNLIPIYEEGWDDEPADEIEERMARILKLHGGDAPPGLSNEPPVA